MPPRQGARSKVRFNSTKKINETKLSLGSIAATKKSSRSFFSKPKRLEHLHLKAPAKKLEWPSVTPQERTRIAIKITNSEQEKKEEDEGPKKKGTGRADINHQDQNGMRRSRTSLT